MLSKQDLKAEQQAIKLLESNKLKQERIKQSLNEEKENISHMTIDDLSKQEYILYKLIESKDLYEKINNHYNYNSKQLYINNNSNNNKSNKKTKYKLIHPDIQPNNYEFYYNNNTNNIYNTENNNNNNIENKSKSNTHNTNIIKLPKQSNITNILLNRLEDVLNTNNDLHTDLLLDSEYSLNLDEKTFQYRIFKHLESHDSLYLSSSDLLFRNKIMNSYLFHIVNHCAIRREESLINDIIEELLTKDYNSIHEQIKNELFNMNDIDNLVRYYNKGLYKGEDNNDNTNTNNTNNNNTFNSLFKEYKCNTLLDILSKEEIQNNIYNENNIKNNKYENNHYLLKKLLENKDNLEDKIKDCGFTSAKSLIIVPNKKHCKLIIEQILFILFKTDLKGVHNKKKFYEEFSEADSLDDCFRLGIQLDLANKKIKLFSPFHESDIIIGSPLGLKLTANTKTEKVDDGIKTYSYLSSIEVLLIDFSELFLYQNIDYLEEIINCVNLFPKDSTSLNSINRIKDNYKDYYIDKNTNTNNSTNDINNNSKNKHSILKSLKQVIIVSHFKSLELEALIKNNLNTNIKGMITIKQKPDNVINKIKQDIINNNNNSNNNNKLTTKFEFKFLQNKNNSTNLNELTDYKFNFFINNLYQNLYDTFDRHTIIFTSSSLDYLKLKSHFKTNSVSFAYINEHTEKEDWQRQRLKFENGKYKFLLFSERAHFYKKINLRFAKNIFFYSLPEDPSIFVELCELINPASYKEKLEKYEFEDPEKNSDNYSAVICLVDGVLEKYNVEKILGSNITNEIYKKKESSYYC